MVFFLSLCYNLVTGLVSLSGKRSPHHGGRLFYFRPCRCISQYHSAGMTITSKTNRNTQVGSMFTPFRTLKGIALAPVWIAAPDIRD
jgi:hypothetical protein